MINNFVYEFGDSLYLNLTNRCPNNCEFCIRHIKDGVSGNKLWLNREPTFDDLVEDISMYPLSKYKEVVFCGFGEPTCNLSMMSQIGPYLKRKGCRIRLNTNGLSNLINNRQNTAALLKKYVDVVSISLNASNAETYNEICRSKYGLKAFDAMLDFARECVAEGIETVFSVVDFIGDEEIAACKLLADEVGATLKVRETIYEDTQY